MSDETDKPEADETETAATETDQPGTDEPFDAIAAVAELEAAMAAADAAADRQRDGAAVDRYIAELENDVLSLNALVEAREAQLKQAEERADRARAEIDRARERLQRESTVQLERRTRKVLAAFVEVFDDLERALTAAREAEPNAEVTAGWELVQRRFLSTLESLGVRQQQAMGQRFDPAQHDAVSMVPAEDPVQDGEIIAVVRPGYAMESGELLRPATVVVARK
jgi:molecular chaperone GrpE